MALHYGPDGAVDGYVSYKFLGWDTQALHHGRRGPGGGHPRAPTWSSGSSSAAIDLVERITWEEAPVDDPLTWALDDPRCIDSSDSRDMLWLRILDVGQALEARHYPVDGRLVLEVSTPLA